MAQKDHKQHNKTRGPGELILFMSPKKRKTKDKEKERENHRVTD